jgi:enoyl-CoA hydratase/carnithine racemase
MRRKGAIGTLVVSNLDKHNAMTGRMWESLPSRLAELEDDPAIRVIVLTGDGDKAFVSVRGGRLPVRRRPH